MKTITLFIAFLAITSFTQNSIAQDKSMGLYLTLNDYQNHKLSFETVEGSSNSIRLNSLFESASIVVWHDGKKQVFSKNEIFGYRSKNEDYRFFNNSAYKIIDTKDFYIYSHPKLNQQGKGLKPVDTYYFSDVANGKLQPLTIGNLEVAFAKNPKFKYTIGEHFKSDNELIAYDPTIKEYKLKYLFDQSTK
jgi:hypothetical protein